MIPVSSKELYEAYKAWFGCSGEDPRKGTQGLCAYMGSGFNPLKREMKVQFRAAGLSDIVPFNTSLDEFRAEARRQGIHLNPVRDRIADYEKEHGI